jgi:hypothetical protein
MQKLTGRLVALVGVDREAAEKAVRIVLSFRRQEGAAEDVIADARTRGDALV